MANDIDMLRDIEEYREEGEEEIAEELEICFSFRYGNDSGSEASMKKAERLKRAFQNKHGYWGNYY